MGARSIEVVVDFPRLVVELVELDDPEGMQLEEIRVACDQLEQGDDGTLLVTGHRFASTAADGTVDFEIRPGRSYRVSADVAGVGKATEQIDAPPNTLDLRHRLVIVRRRAAQREASRHRHWRERHAPSERHRFPHAQGLRRDAATGWTDLDAAGWWSVPAGVYDVEIEVDVYDKLDAYEMLFEPISNVSIPVDGERELTVPVRAGGRFRVTWRAASGTFSPAGVSSPRPEGGATELLLFQRDRGAIAQVRCVTDDADSQEEEPWWLVAVAHDPQERYSEIRFLPDEEYRSRLLLKPGRYRLRVECPGIEAGEKTITLYPGVETHVKVELSPR